MSQRISRLCLRCLMALLGVLTIGNAAALELSLDGDLMQGGMIVGKTEPGALVELDGRAIRLSADGHFVFGFGRDAATNATLTITNGPDRLVRELTVSQREYKIQRINGLPPKMVSPDPEQLARIRRENAWIAEVRRRDTDALWFAEPFASPAQGPISGVYGSQRILNGEPRRPHFGLDVAAPTGTAVTAPAHGIVALAEPDLYFTGGTVMLDHGHGITSVYSHLSRIDVPVGQSVERGEPIGAVGATGRATGPHLDWRVNWFEVRLDPALLLEQP